MIILKSPSEIMLMREAGRLLAPLSQLGELGETQAFLACVIADQSRPDEAERFVVEAEAETRRNR